MSACPCCGYTRPVGRVAIIQAAVAAYYEIPLTEMTSSRRPRAVAHPRQVAMFLARDLTEQSLPQIGRLFGKRDHTTVMWAIDAVEKRIEGDPQVAIDVAILRERLAA